MPDLLSVESIKYLRENNIEIIYISGNSSNITLNIAYINQYIQEYIDKIKNIIPEWIKFSYIRALFLMSGTYSGHEGNNIRTKNDQQRVIKKIHEIRGMYLSKKNLYPYQTYISWPYPFRESDGNILFNDVKFLKLLYAANKDRFQANEYLIDAKSDTKEEIYQFVDEAKNIAIFVDCENVDPYCFSATLLNLDNTSLSKIKKIVLYDDVNTSTAWDYIETILNIPIEHKQVVRVLENKSLVAIALTTGVCEEFYRNDVESIILASSDSDFWGLIENLPSARFLVLNERRKTSNIILGKLDEKNIWHCFLNDFALDKVQQFKTNVLQRGLWKKIEEFNSSGTFGTLDVEDLIQELFYDANICGAESQINKEKESFFNKYLKNGFIVRPTEEDGRIVLKMDYIKK